MLRRISRFLYPPQCLGCGSSYPSYFCPRCRSTCIATRSLIAEAEVLTLGAYDGALRRLIKAIKQSGQREAGREISALACHFLLRSMHLAAKPKLYAIAPSVLGQRYRGFSLPDLIAHELLSKTEWDLIDSRLAAQFGHLRSSSKGLGLQERFARKQLMAKPAGSGEDLGSILIIDDVITTGATMAYAVKIARGLGFSKVTCFALAMAAAS